MEQGIDISATLRSLRESLELGVREMARAMGVSHGTYTTWETPGRGTYASTVAPSIALLAAKLEGDVSPEPLMNFVFGTLAEDADGMLDRAALKVQWPTPPRWREGQSPHRKAGRRPQLRSLEGGAGLEPSPEPPSGAPPGHVLVPAEPFSSALAAARRASALSRAGDADGVAEAVDDLVANMLFCDLPKEAAMDAMNKRRWIRATLRAS